jgi:penicillin-insensitive murein endopeptidase
VLWFREAVAAPAFAGIGSAAIPSLSPPPGLVASRVRRAAWERRRHLRRARTTAVALSPAVVIALAALRSGSGPEASVVLDDPPSLTFRVGTGLPVPERTTIGPPPAPGSGPAGRRESAARSEAAPQIAWHHATSTGLPWAGSLADGTQLPLEGPDWVTWNPVTDSLPNAPRRLYGTERAIRAIVSVAAAYRAAHPDAPRLVVGDISREGGGPMTDEHVSHQNGLDVDIYFPRLDHELRAPVAPEQIDRRLAQDLVDRFVAVGAQMIFVGYRTGLRGPSGVVTPYAGHDYHMHVRFPPGG